MLLNFTGSQPVFRKLPYELKRVASQAIGSSDSVHRNIAEGYCQKSIREYLNFLNIALGSLGENVSGLHAYRQAGQINEEDFVTLNELAFKLENGLLKLVESLERKKLDGDWVDSLLSRRATKSTEIHVQQRCSFGGLRNPLLQYSNTPSLQRGIVWIFSPHII